MGAAKCLEGAESVHILYTLQIVGYLALVLAGLLLVLAVPVSMIVIALSLAGVLQEERA